MSENTLTYSELDTAVKRLVPVLDPVELRVVLRDSATQLGVDWGEAGEGSATRLNAAAVVFVMDATTALHRSFEGWKRNNTAARKHSPFIEERRKCADPACVRENHEWSGGERTEACELTPIEGPHKWYRVHGNRTSDDSEWVVWVDADCLPDGPPAGAAARCLATDIDRMQAEVDRLNGMTS